LHCYTVTKASLQAAGLVAKAKRRGAHRQVNSHAVGVVGHEGAALATLLPAGCQHELLLQDRAVNPNFVHRRHHLVTSDVIGQFRTLCQGRFGVFAS
jgi:hypothetical protein